MNALQRGVINCFYALLRGLLGIIGTGLFSSAFFLMAAWADEASDLTFTDAETRWLQAHPVLRVAGPKAFPPFQYVNDEGELAGMTADYIQILEERLGVRMEVHLNLPWSDVLEKARLHELDLISCAARTAERETYLSFTHPYLSFPMVIISRKEGPFIYNYETILTAIQEALDQHHQKYHE